MSEVALTLALLVLLVVLSRVQLDLYVCAPYGYHELAIGIKGQGTTYSQPENGADGSNVPIVPCSVVLDVVSVAMGE